MNLYHTITLWGCWDLQKIPWLRPDPTQPHPLEAALALIPPRRDATGFWYAGGAHGRFLPAHCWLLGLGEGRQSLPSQKQAFQDWKTVQRAQAGSSGPNRQEGKAQDPQSLSDKSRILGSGDPSLFFSAYTHYTDRMARAWGGNQGWSDPTMVEAAQGPA